MSGRERRRRLRGLALRLGLVALVAFAALQLVPYGWRHDNPAVVADAPWPSPESATLARAACYDCHSNETRWPVYSYVAPMSWLVRRDVDGGLHELNFSDWGEDGGEADDAAEAVARSSMPPRQYLLVHPDARLSDGERQVLVDALVAMDGGGGGGGDGGNRGPGGGDDDRNGDDNGGRGGGD